MPYHVQNDFKPGHIISRKLILQILYWISEIAIHSRVFILALPASIGL
jgi:hypothetical protein